jgi:hypothetical protein
MTDQRSITLLEERIALFYTVGRCISQWAHVEGVLRHAVADTAPPVDRVGLGKAFLSIESFHSKRKFADHIIGVKHKNSALADRWLELSDRLNRGAANRNKLVHYKPVLFPDDAPGRRFVLVKWIRDKEPNRSKRIFAPQEAVGLIRVASFRADFHGLTTAIANFREAAVGREEPFPKAAEQPTYPTDLRTLVDQMAAGL